MKNLSSVVIVTLSVLVYPQFGRATLGHSLALG
jgi:hypothetical protein